MKSLMLEVKMNCGIIMLELTFLYERKLKSLEFIKLVCCKTIAKRNEYNWL